jgi:hypothetical protein
VGEPWARPAADADGPARQIVAAEGTLGASGGAFRRPEGPCMERANSGPQIGANSLISAHPLQVPVTRPRSHNILLCKLHGNREQLPYVKPFSRKCMPPYPWRHGRRYSRGQAGPGRPQPGGGRPCPDGPGGTPWTALFVQRCVHRSQVRAQFSRCRKGNR